MRLQMTALLLCAALSTAAASPLRSRPRPASFTPGVLLVAEDGGEAVTVGPGGGLRLSDPRLATVLGSLGIESARRLDASGRAARVGATRFLELRSTRADFEPRAAAAMLRATGAFRAVCPDYRLTLFDLLPNDPDLGAQWSIGGGAAAIRLPEAWEVERGDTSVLIAIMDTGVDLGHPDLASKIWTNPGEIPANGIDDDGDGLVDDVHGWDFGMNDADPDPEYTQDPSGLDVGFHGTFCAALAAAATDNGEGIAGAAWRCRLLPLKVTDPDSGITTRAVTEAFLYAADHHADVLSMSFGGPGDPGVPEYFQALVDEVTAAGVLCVAAAGNDADSVRSWPAACNDVIAVGATDESNARAYFSNWGPWVDVAAPGSGMWSAICRNYVLTDLDQIFYMWLFGWDGERPYMSGDGTSFSTPLTAGVCALIRSRFPSLSPAQVARQLVETGDVLPFDLPVGPKVDAYQAVSMSPVAVETGPPPVALRLEPTAPNPFTRGTTLRWTRPADGLVGLTIFDCAGRHVRTLTRAVWPAGAHQAPWDGRDEFDRPVAGGVYLARIESGGCTAVRKLVRLER